MHLAFWKVNILLILESKYSQQLKLSKDTWWCFKGTVSRDFGTPVFSSNISAQTTDPYPKIFAQNGGEFDEVFEFQITDDAAGSWLSGVNGTTKAKASGFINIAEEVQNLVRLSL